MVIQPRYTKGDMVVFKLSKDSKMTYNGVVLDSWTSKANINNQLRVYTVASMNHGMRSYSVSEEYIVKKIS